MFEQPAKRDVDYALSTLMHEARRRVADEKNRITSEATKVEAPQSNRVIVAVVDAADKIHAASMNEAKQALLGFIQRIAKPAKEITAWARPHLENLSNVVLAGIPPNAIFPDDHRRLIGQYQAIFRQRVEGMLREVEIGYVRGSGFLEHNSVSEETEWISAAAALELLGMSPQCGPRTICNRAHAGLIRARATRFIQDSQATDNVDVPREFWWAGGGQALSQNWTTGDFETWLKGVVRLQAFGVTFLRSDIERAKPFPGQHKKGQKMTAGKNIFIGHGHSPIWRELKDFLSSRLDLSVDEFNLVATAGVATANRLEEMLNDTAFAFLVFTAEDEQGDGTFNARLNVIHEAGLFQGRLGFKRAIVMLEDGCNDFSNIHGLGQLRFPKGRIGAEFEEIRRVLEREGIITPS